MTKPRFSMSLILSSASWPSSAVTTAYLFSSSASRIVSRRSHSSSITSTSGVMSISDVRDRQRVAGNVTRKVVPSAALD